MPISQYPWHVMIALRQGLNPVSIAMYMSCSYTDASEYLETRKHLVTKNRKVYIKERVTHEEAEGSP